MAQLEYRTHVFVVALANIGFSALILFIGLFGMVFLTGIGLVAEDVEAARILSFIGCAGVLFLGTLAVPGFFAGYGLLKRRVWGRILGIVVAALDLFNIPIGTAFGIYSLWVLTEQRAEAYFGAAEGEGDARGAVPPVSH